MLYSPNIQTSTPTITGHSLAHARRTVAERAFVAADLHSDRIALSAPTIGQSARLAGICRHYAAAAVAIADDPESRAAVLAGRVSLIGAAKSAAGEMPAPVNVSAVIGWLRSASFSERVDVVRGVGVNDVWDALSTAVA
jgi:hypothetical protein